MIYSFDNNNQSMEQFSEANENTITGEQLSETEETSENFDDCSIDEFQDSRDNEINPESLEKAEENYDDCQAKIEEMEEKNLELAEDDDNFEDCSKETDDQYATEVIYTVEGKTSQEEAATKLQEAYNECGDTENMQQLKETAQECTDDLENQINKNEKEILEGTENIINDASEDAKEDIKVVESEDLEQLDDDTKVEVSQINEEDVSEDVFQNVEEQTETELSDETKEKIQEDIAENIDSEAEKGKIFSEKAKEVINENVEANVDNIEEKQELADEIIDVHTGELVENENLTDDEIKEKIFDEVKESTGENLLDEDAEAIAEEKPDEIEDAIEEEKEKQEYVETIEETVEELENDHIKQDFEVKSKSLQERIDDAFEKDDISSSEINDLREENTIELKIKVEEKSITETKMKSKFDEVLSKVKGSEEYRQSLREYNDLQNQNENLAEQIATLEIQQELLDKKSIKLREAQIQKGVEAIDASAITLIEVNELQDRYDQTYYDAKPDKAELTYIREENSSKIKELSTEKGSIKQAMDAKMDEIREYVVSNNMDRYDTAHNLRYQQLSAEYNVMRESYDRIRYSIVNLDENNKAITEELGDEYVSMVELPPVSRIPEVVSGTDIPGETNYFVDEAKVAEVLSPFKQDNWEQLSINEQKQAVEKLADYNAEILGIEDKPRIVYYNVDDPCNFGGYSEKQNTIYINEYNMHDAAETADTISHEYRHKYQHERANKLETQKDLEFKEGFDNYIYAEDD